MALSERWKRSIAIFSVIIGTEEEPGTSEEAGNDETQTNAQTVGLGLQQTNPKTVRPTETEQPSFPSTVTPTSVLPPISISPTTGENCEQFSPQSTGSVGQSTALVTPNTAARAITTLLPTFEDISPAASPSPSPSSGIGPHQETTPVEQIIFDALISPPASRNGSLTSEHRIPSVSPTTSAVSAPLFDRNSVAGTPASLPSTGNDIFDFNSEIDRRSRTAPGLTLRMDTSLNLANKFPPDTVIYCQHCKKTYHRMFKVWMHEKKCHMDMLHQAINSSNCRLCSGLFVGLLDPKTMIDHVERNHKPYLMKDQSCSLEKALSICFYYDTVIVPWSDKDCKELLLPENSH